MNKLSKKQLKRLNEIKKTVDSMVKKQLKEYTGTGSVVGIQAPVNKTKKKEIKEIVEEAFYRICMRQILREEREYIVKPETPSLGIPMEADVSMNIEGNSLEFNLRGGDLEIEKAEGNVKHGESRTSSIEVLKVILDLLEANGIIRDAKIMYETFRRDIEGERGMLNIDIDVPFSKIVEILNHGGLSAKPFKEGAHTQALKKLGKHVSDEEMIDYYQAALEPKVQQREKKAKKKLDLPYSKEELKKLYHQFGIEISDTQLSRLINKIAKERQ